MQAPSPLHTSAVQTTLSLFSQLVPAGQLGWWQVVSVPLQTSLVQGFKSSAHGVPFALIISMGHAPDVPEQVSATSHGPAEARHVTPAARNASTQALRVPVQRSGASLS